nr:hypothetical protein [Bradyrhizobium sp.]
MKLVFLLLQPVAIRHDRVDHLADFVAAVPAIEIEIGVASRNLRHRPRHRPDRSHNGAGDQKRHQDADQSAGKSADSDHLFSGFRFVCQCAGDGARPLGDPRRQIMQLIGELLEVVIGPPQHHGRHRRVGGGDIQSVSRGPVVLRPFDLQRDPVLSLPERQIRLRYERVDAGFQRGQIGANFLAQAQQKRRVDAVTSPRDMTEKFDVGRNDVVGQLRNGILSRKVCIPERRQAAS